MAMKPLLAIPFVLAVGAGNPAWAEDEGLMRMVLVTQMYQEIAARCDAIAVDADYINALNETSELLRPYVSDEARESIQATLASERVNCSPESNWVQMFLSAQEDFSLSD